MHNFNLKYLHKYVSAIVVLSIVYSFIMFFSVIPLD